jgi:type III secretory pathway component EscT
MIQTTLCKCIFNFLFVLFYNNGREHNFMVHILISYVELWQVGKGHSDLEALGPSPSE